MMRLISRAALVALALTFAGAGTARAPARPAARAAAAPAVPPIRYHSRTLANGLRVYAIRDPNSANVSVQVWYDVGSKDDPRGRSGFAHLFEHMMFKSTPQPRPRAVRPADRGCRRLQQRLDQRRLHQLLRGRPRQPSAAPALGRGRADELAGDRAGLLRLRARRGEGGVAQPRARPALWPALLSLSPADLLRRASLCPARHRQHRGSRRGDDRGRARLPRHLLPARQCGAGRRRQFRSRPSSIAGSTNISAPIARPATRDPARHRGRARARARRATTPSTSRTRRCPRC